MPDLEHQNREFIGYGQNPPDPRWPGNAKICISFVLNYEEGSENCVLNDDFQSESLLTDMGAVPPIKSGRNVAAESLFEYGSRAGFWRLHRLFTRRKIPLTVYACGMALERNDEAAKAMVAADWEVASHGYRWIDYSGDRCQDSARLEKEHIEQAIKAQELHCGYRPFGFYQGKPSPSSRRLALETGHLYDNDVYSDDLPFWSEHYTRTDLPFSESRGSSNVDSTDRLQKSSEGGRNPLLLIPYTLCVNDMRFVTPLQGFPNGDAFFSALKDSFDVLYEEGSESPKMMTIGLHCRIIGHPSRIKGLIRFLDYIEAIEQIWVCRRLDIALHWYRHHYPSGAPKKKDAAWRMRLGVVGEKPKVVQRMEWCTVGAPMRELVEAAFGRKMDATGEGKANDKQVK